MAAQKRRMTKEDQKLRRKLLRRRLVTLVASVFCVYFLVTIITTQIKIHNEKLRLSELEQQIDAQQLENDELARIISGDENVYIERLAREKLGYAAIDERVYIDISGS